MASAGVAPCTRRSLRTPAGARRWWAGWSRRWWVCWSTTRVPCCSSTGSSCSLSRPPTRAETGSALASMARMRIALVSPYSWTYPGGVTRHIEALAEQLLRTGQDVDVLAPFDPDDRLSVRMHAGARPEPRAVPDYLIPLGRTVGLPANGAVSNIAVTANPVLHARRALEQGGYDVVH